MKTKNLLITFLLTSTVTFADTTEQIHAHVNDTMSFVDGLERRVVERPIPGPAHDLQDYQNAREDLMRRISEASQDYKACLVSISNQAVERISEVDLNIAELRQHRDAGLRSSDLERLIDDKMEERQNVLTNLESSLESTYRGCVMRYMGLDGFLTIWIKARITREARRLRAYNLVPLLGTMGAEISIHGYDVENVYPVSWTGATMRNTDYKSESRWNYRERMHDWNNFHGGERLFSACETDLCRYYFINDIMSWIEQVQNVNVDLGIVDGLSLGRSRQPYNSRRRLRKIRAELEEMARSLVSV